MTSPTVPAVPTTRQELRAALDEPLPLEQVDLDDLDNFADGIKPWRMFHTLRHEDPVHWQPEEAPNSGFWAVTRHADIARVDRDPETFTSTKFVNLEEVDEDQIKKRASILEMDGVRHRALRSVIQRQFGASVINSYSDFLRGLTAKTLDAALAKGTFDFVAEAHRLGQAHHRQHRPRLCGRPAAQRREREVPRSALPFTRLHRGLRVRPGAGPAAARRRRHRPGLQARQHHPARRDPALRAGLRQLLPAPGRRRQRDYAPHHHPLHAGPAPAP